MRIPKVDSRKDSIRKFKELVAKTGKSKQKVAHPHKLKTQHDVLEIRPMTPHVDFIEARELNKRISAGSRETASDERGGVSSAPQRARPIAPIGGTPLKRKISMTSEIQ